MNYYEELGIKPGADEEEIRRAHRRLVKLMHPDQQLDPGLKQLAETQMRRLNSIVSTLLDPEERRDYDDDLYSRDIPRTVARAAWRAIPWWIASTLGAIVLTVGAVWFWADHLGSSFSRRTTVYIPPQESVSSPGSSDPSADQSTRSMASSSSSTEAAPAYPPIDPPSVASAATAPGEKQPVDGHPGSVLTSALPPASKPETPDPSGAPPKPDLTAEANAKAEKAHPLPANPASANPPANSGLAAKEPDPGSAKALEVARSLEPPSVSDGKKQFKIPDGTQLASPRPHASLPPAPGLGITPVSHEVYASAVPVPVTLPPATALPDVNQPAKSVAASTSGSEGLEGEWVYSPKEPEKHRPGFYPPEFISLKLKKESDGFHGQYSARYDVADNRPISPDVTFQLKSVDKGARKFVWQSSNGSKGTLAIRSVDGETIRLEWRTTVFSGGSALTSGIATLVRRSQ